MLISALIKQLKATQAGDPWYGRSRTGFLDDLSAKDAAAHPVEDGHSIWEVVLHMTAWTREVIHRLQGNHPGEPEDGDWPAVGRVTAERWRDAREALADAHGELIRLLERLPEERWNSPVGKQREPALGTGVTVGGMIIGLAQHDAYHIGQLAVLRQALGKPPA
ncbi:MAG TPA: DinB family protein [Gemmatimonadales bacterium]|nr:DinB family protein [Gemmatimonadales bacterium]